MCARCGCREANCPNGEDEYEAAAGWREVGTGEGWWGVRDGEMMCVDCGDRERVNGGRLCEVCMEFEVRGGAAKVRYDKVLTHMPHGMGRFAAAMLGACGEVRDEGALARVMRGDGNGGPHAKAQRAQRTATAGK